MQAFAHLFVPVLGCTSIILQIGSSDYCKLKVTMLNNTDNAISCFNKMHGGQCNLQNSTSYCKIEKQNGETCIKWSDADMTCMETSQFTKVPLENRCAQDQQSMDCTREFTTSTLKNSAHVTTFLGGVHIGLIIPLLFLVTYLTNWICL